MDYIDKNKQAWEEAFDHRHPGWGEDNFRRLREEQLPFFCPDVAAQLKAMDFAGKTVGQFCCNNGRELLSLLQLGAERGVGFDIAENIIAQARDTAQKAGINNCEFVCTNILEIGSQYSGAFDFLMLTIGAITWFEDLGPLFRKAADCLKPGGVLLLHDYHPFMNMLATPGEPAFQEGSLDRLTYPYFKAEPWIENEGMGYMSQQYESKTFTSFSHTMAGIVGALHHAGLNVTKLDEYDYDVGLTDAYDGRGYPLSFLLLAQKA